MSCGNSVNDSKSFSIYRTEPQIFKTKFIGWDDVIPVDYTRTAESVIRRGADMKVRTLDKECT
jgi:hypothetical protein